MENLFDSLGHPDSIMFLISMLVAFLIGFLVAWILWSGLAKRYQKEAEKWKKSHADLALELSAVREQLELKDADVVKARREAAEALERFNAFQEDRAKWQSDLDQSLEETVRLHASSHDYQAAIEDLNNQILELKTSNELLAQGVGNENMTTQIQSSYSATLDRLGSLEEKIGQLIAENDALRAAARKEDDELLAMLKYYADSSNRLGSLEAKIGALVDENDSLRAELTDLKSTDAVAILMAEPGLEAARRSGDKEALTSGEISPSDAKDEVLAAIGTTIPAATADQKNDLTKIKGIGSFLEKKLNSLGIYTFGQISQFRPDFIEKVTTAIEFFPGRIERDNWVGQATLLAQAGGTSDPAPAAVSSGPDDLKIVEGIGPKIEKLLNSAGILSLRDLGNASLDQLRNILLNAGERYRIHDPSTWPEQAALAANGELDKLKEYQDFLSGGKDPG
ncbi:MAG: hypothetical protein HY842_17125 [Bacteroidetes bacterium]|nr:hypothetical protein [Bacteroidota bacterium]